MNQTYKQFLRDRKVVDSEARGYWAGHTAPEAVSRERADQLRAQWRRIEELVEHGRTIGKRYTASEVRYVLERDGLA